MFRPIYCVPLLLVLGHAIAGDNFDSFCPTKSSSTTLSRLRMQLLCDYDSILRPVKDHRNATTVQFRLLLKYFQYDHFSHMLSVDTWFTTYWIDQHLKWKPDDFDGIKSIHLLSNEIWIPDISIYNRKDQSTDPKAIGDTTCSVNYLGVVLCVPPLHFDALCVPNLNKYPYDTQKCTVRFGSWIHKGEEINLKLINPIIDTEDLESNGEWELASFKAVRHKGNYSCCPNNTYPSIDVVMEIKRNGHMHAINIILPLLVCILVTLTTMAMSPLNKDRFVLGCVSLLGHILHVQNLSYMVPITGDDLPSLMTISRDSTLMAAVAIIATVVLKNIMHNRSESPAWVGSTTAFLIATRPGQLIFLPDNSLKGAAAAEKQEDGETIISNVETLPTTTQSDWLIFAKFIDVVLLAIYVFVYFIILIQF